MMIGRLLAVGAAVAAAAAGAGAAMWAKRKAEEDAALQREILDAVEDATPATVEVESAVDAAPDTGGNDGSDDDGADDLTEVKGIGAVSAERLDGVGVTTFAQIAGWSDDDLEAVAAKIKVSPERMRREDWVGQARAILGR
jgi:large subunit ribosomal protein L21